MKSMPKCYVADTANTNLVYAANIDYCSDNKLDFVLKVHLSMINGGCMEQCYECVRANVTLDQAGTCRLAKSSAFREFF